MLQETSSNFEARVPTGTTETNAESWHDELAGEE